MIQQIGKDFLGRDVYLGDRVVCVKPNTVHLLIGTVVRITPKGATVELKNEVHGYTWKTSRLSEQIVRIDENSILHKTSEVSG